MNNPKEKRKLIRVPIITGKVDLRQGHHSRSVDVNDISGEGIFIKTDILLAPGSQVEIGLHLPGDLGVLLLESKVVRVRWGVPKGTKVEEAPLGMALRFKTTLSQQKILDAYVVYLRNRNIIDVSKRIISEFFGDKQPPSSQR